MVIGYAIPLTTRLANESGVPLPINVGLFTLVIPSFTLPESDSTSNFPVMKSNGSLLGMASIFSLESSAELELELELNGDDGVCGKGISLGTSESAGFNFFDNSRLTVLSLISFFSISSLMSLILLFSLFFNNFSNSSIFFFKLIS